MSDPVLRTIQTALLLGKAKGGLHYIRGNKKPYFSLTGDFKERRNENSRWEDGTSGACHDEILKYWPELKQLADLHLCDIDGVPGHGSANGWYWLIGATPMLHGVAEYHGANSNRDWKTRDIPATAEEVARSFRIFCDHVRVSEHDARVLQGRLQTEFANSADSYERLYRPREVGKMILPVFNEWFEAQKPRWKEEARKCILDFRLKVYGDYWEPTPSI